MSNDIRITEFMNEDELRQLIQRAKLEDMGPDAVDITSELLVDADVQGHAKFTGREEGVLAGVAVLGAVVNEYDPQVMVTELMADGDAIKGGDLIAELAGPLRSILAIERVALNFMTHLSGIATLTNLYVQAVAHMKAEIWDTRKTHAGLRQLEKYAVKCGGGKNHRIGLYDAVLVKDNHIAHLSLDKLAEKLKQMTEAIRTDQVSPRPSFVDVEVDSLEQLAMVLPCGIDMVLLDNMSLDELRQAVAMRDEMARDVKLEASGGVNLQTVGDIAETGVDLISIGALTHSAVALDIGLDIE